MLYANIDHFTAQENYDSRHIMDRYILSKLQLIIDSVRDNMDNYRIPDACEQFYNFIKVLNNWYIRRSRERFWRSGMDQDKMDAYNTLYTVLLNLSLSIAPLLPITAELIYSNLRSN